MNVERPNEKTRPYVLGHSESELSRLERQAAFYSATTEDVLRRAGIGPGMRVLDIGCGVGDVAMLAAKLVGAEGAVLGVDRSERALDAARARAARAGFSWARFEATDFMELRPEGRFDAVTGRMILMYMADPAETLRHLAGLVRPGGTLAFVEIDVSSAGAVPELPLFRENLERIVDIYRHVGIEPNMGSKLFGAFRAAGLDPELAGTMLIEGGPNAAVYDYLAETVRSLLPRMAEFGLVAENEVGIETLSDRLRRAAVEGGHCLMYPRLIGAWARTPAG